MLRTKKLHLEGTQLKLVTTQVGSLDLDVASSTSTPKWIGSEEALRAIGIAVDGGGETTVFVVCVDRA